MFGSFPSAYQIYNGDTDLYKEYEILPPLAGDGVDPQTPNYSLTRDVIRGNFVITSAAEDPALILRWLDYFYSEEGAMFRTGREGIEWKKAEDGEIGFNGEPAKYVEMSTPEDDEYYQNVDFSQSIPYLMSKEHRESAATAQDFRADGVNNWNEVQLFQGTKAYEEVAKPATESLPPLTVPAEKADDYARMKTEIEDYMSTSDVISTYVYRIGIGSAQFSYSTAIGLFNSVVSVILLVLVNTISSKVSETSLF